MKSVKIHHGLIITFPDGIIPEEHELPATDTIKPHTGVATKCTCERNIFLPHAMLDNSDGGICILTPTRCKCGLRVDETEATRRLMWGTAFWAVRYEEKQI